MNFEGKVVLITGAAQGFGRAIAARLVEAGAFVAVNDIDAEKAQAAAQELGEFASAYPCDVSNSAQVADMVEALLSARGRIDGLVNNAGIDKPAHILDITEEDWDRVLAVNLKSVFLCSKAVLPAMIRQKSGAIVNISSVTGRQGALKGGIHYSTSKAGILGFTKTLARLVAEHNIRVNAVAPGTSETAIIEGLSPEFLANLANSIPMKRLGKPDDIAKAVRFLLSDDASYITGATLDVNGGAWMG